MTEKVWSPLARTDVQVTITPETAKQAVVDLLAQASGLSKSALKDAMNKGAVWLHPKRGAVRRLRRAQAKLYAGDRVKLHYDAELLKATTEAPRLLVDEGTYSLWYKPAGMLSQGTEYGDHLSLLRQTELWLRQARNDNNAATWLVHRLDREACGLMLVAHTKAAAGALSQAFQDKRMEKVYWAEVAGETPEQGRIDNPLDGKAAVSHYRRLSLSTQSHRSTLEVRIETGRQHQIRRHLEALGHPVMGDPRYGRDNKNRSGLKLVAWRLSFTCPLTKQPRDYDLARLAPDLFTPAALT